MSDENKRLYTGTILLEPQNISTPQIILDCKDIYEQQSAWISAYASLPTTINPHPIFYSKPGWEFFLENLQINYYAASLEAADPPDVQPNSSQPEIMGAIKAVNREYKKFQLLLLQRELPNTKWHLIAIEYLHNYGDIFNYLPLKNPFLSQGDVAIYGTSSQLAIQFNEQDSLRKIEMPQSGDTISIVGSWRSVLSL